LKYEASAMAAQGDRSAATVADANRSFFI